MESETVSYEELILQKIRDAGQRGITQAELAKELKLPVDVVSRTLSQLVRKKRVIKKPVKEESKTVVKYFIAESEKRPLLVELNLLEKIPCYTCKNLFKCGNGSVINPGSCTLLTNFLLSLEPHSL